MDTKDQLTANKSKQTEELYVPAEEAVIPTYRNKIQTFLAIWAALMMLGILIAFCLTNNPAVLVGTTVIGVAVYSVYHFYFTRRPDTISAPPNHRSPELSPRRDQRE